MANGRSGEQGKGGGAGHWGPLPRLLGLALSACTQTKEASAPPEPRPSQQVQAYERLQIGGVLRGISGLAQDPSGRLLLIPERDRHAYYLDLATHTLSPAEGLPIEGVPEGLDLESAAFQDGQLLFGTEAKQPRNQDLILRAEVRADRIVVQGELALGYGPFQTEAEPNHGLEGLCATSTEVLAVSETVVGEGQRYAPLFIVQKGTQAISTHRIQLLTKKGKLSGLACRTTDRGLEVVAIERHFETSRLVYFRLPQQGAPEAIEPIELVDLARLYQGQMPPNFESLEILSDRTVLLVADNDYGGVDGPTELLKVQLSPDPASGGFRTGGAP